MTTQCLWCDDPTSGHKLCDPCRAVNEHPPFHCHKPEHSVPTLGPSCSWCDEERNREVARAARNAPQIAQLLLIRESLVRDWNKPWVGMNFAKALMGQSIDAALKDLS